MFLTHGVLWAELSPFLMPVWFLSAGATQLAVVLLIVYGISAAASRHAARTAWQIVSEGVLQFVGYLVLVLALFALATSFQVPLEGVMSSLRRIPTVGTVSRTFEVPLGTANHPLDIQFYPEEVQSYDILSSQDLKIDSRTGDKPTPGLLDLRAEELLEWQKTPGGPSPFPGETNVEQLYATNPSNAAAKVTLNMVTNVEYPQVYSILIAAGSLVLLFAIYFAIRLAFPKVAAIAAATSKQAVFQPIFPMTLICGAALLVGFNYLPYNTFGEDVKMLNVTGLTLIRVLAIVVALWTASVSIADEIEGRTALTLLSKPIGRRQFILGKYLGIIWPVALMFIVLGFWFLAVVSYKVVYDAKEGAHEAPNWQMCYAAMVQTIPGLVLGFMETIMLAAVSVAISTRLPMLANLVICASIYALGHLVPLIVQSPVGSFDIVHFVGMLIATVLPNLDHFNIEASMFSDKPVPLAYLGWTLMYCVLYSGIAMLLALALFEDRDLA